MLDLTDNRLPLYNVLLKASRLGLLLDMPKNVQLFKTWSKDAEKNMFVTENFRINMEAAKDASRSYVEAAPDPLRISPQMSNTLERIGLRNNATNVVGTLAHYRSETFNFASGVYSRYQFGNIAESVFQRKRGRTEPALREIFPDIGDRLNSVEQNILSDNPEDWKNAVSSCRALLMDIADILNPPQNGKEKQQYINRLKDFISPIRSNTKKKLTRSYMDALKDIVEETVDYTQGGAHADRPELEKAEDVVLYTYLVISELIEVHKQRDIES